MCNRVQCIAMSHGGCYVQARAKTVLVDSVKEPHNHRGSRSYLWLYLSSLLSLWFRLPLFTPRAILRRMPLPILFEYSLKASISAALSPGRLYHSPPLAVAQSWAERLRLQKWLPLPAPSQVKALRLLRHTPDVGQHRELSFTVPPSPLNQQLERSLDP